MRIAIALAAAAMVALFQTFVAALDPQVSMDQYLKETWSKKEGLIAASPGDVVQTASGYLWMGTDDGLVRFDGIRFHPFNSDSIPAFSNDAITDLAVDHTDNLWIGTRDGLLTYGNGVFRKINSPGLNRETIISIHIDHSNNVWVATRGKLYHSKAGQFVEFKTSLDDITALSGGLEQNSPLWMLGLSQVIRVEPDLRIAGEPIPIKDAQCLWTDKDGTLWVGSVGQIVRIDHTETKTFPLPNNAMSVKQIFRDNDKNLWVSTTSTFFRFREGNWESFSDKALNTIVVNSIYEDSERNLWLATNGAGLQKLRNPKVLSYSTNQGLPAEFVHSIIEDDKGNLWIGTSGHGLFRYNDGKFQKVSNLDSAFDDVISLMKDSEGAIWAGPARGLAKIENGNITKMNSLFTDAVVFSMVEQKATGDRYFGTTRGIVRQHRDKFELLFPLERNAFTVSILDGNNGSIWFGTYGGGLQKWNGSVLKQYSKNDGLPTNDILSLHLDGQNTLWIGTLGEGLVRFKDGKFVTISKKNGLYNNGIYSILEDSGSLWMGSSTGVFRVSMAEVNSFAEEKIPGIQSYALTEKDGMISAECIGGLQPAAWRSSSGHLWFPTTKGIVKIDPRRLQRNEVPPKILFEELVVDNKVVSHSKNGPTRIRPASGRLEFRFAGLSFADPESVRYRFRLDGFDRDWNDGGTRRSASYTNLRPGKYTFRVIAANSDGVWSTSASSFSFFVAPQIHQTWWFYVLSGFAILLLIYGIHRLRVRRLRSIFNEVLEERNRISREIHDTLTQDFTGIALQLEAAELTPDNIDQLRQSIARAKEISRNGLAESRRFVRALRPVDLQNKPLAAALQDLINRTSTTTGIKAVCEVQGRPRSLMPEVESNLFRMVQEALNNTVKHSGAKKLRLVMKYDFTGTEIRIEDDGKGFESMRAQLQGEGGYGLPGMKERATEIGATLNIQSQSGQGTTVIIKLPRFSWNRLSS